MWVDESSLTSISSVFPFKCGFCYFAAQEKSTLDFHLQLEHEPVSSNVHSWLDKEVVAEEERGFVPIPVQHSNSYPNSDKQGNDSVNNCLLVESTFNSIPSVAQSNFSNRESEAAPEASCNKAQMKQNINSNTDNNPSFKDEFSSYNNNNNNPSKIKPLKVSLNSFSYFKKMAEGKIHSPNIFICGYLGCNYQTLKKNDLLLHLNEFHKDNGLPYRCLFCKSEFEKRKDCILHMLHEHCKQLYLCQFCCNFFTTKIPNWNEHFFKNH